MLAIKVMGVVLWSESQLHVSNIDLTSHKTYPKHETMSKIIFG